MRVPGAGATVTAAGGGSDLDDVGAVVAGGVVVLAGGVMLLGAGVAAGAVPGGCVPGTMPGAALGLEVMLFSTRCTPETPLATSTARANWAGVSTVPVSLTVPLLESTFICVPLTISSAINAAFTLVVSAALSTTLAVALVACLASVRTS